MKELHLEKEKEDCESQTSKRPTRELPLKSSCSHPSALEEGNMALDSNRSQLSTFQLLDVC